MESAVTASADAQPQGAAPAPATPWPLWQRIPFRFFFVYLLLQVAPWEMFSAIPGVSFILGAYDSLVNWAVSASNASLFHVRATLVPVNGSGDTSFAWAQLWLYLGIAAIACAIWSVLDRRRREYHRLLYWLRLALRYYVAAAALSYGLIKVFGLQMPFPTTSDLATPLGDLLPMRFSWFFIGYSTPYQAFAGVMETVAGLLLLYRRTVTAGLFAATGAFANVVMINLSYDVPVKLYSMHLLFACLFLLALDSPRLLNFLVLNRVTPPTDAYTPQFVRPWQRWGSVAVKAFIVLEILILPFFQDRTAYHESLAPRKAGAFPLGIYDVRKYVVNGTPVAATGTDTLRWKDVIFETNAYGSVSTADQMFNQRYHRGFFRYNADTVTHIATMWRRAPIKGDSIFMFTMRYEMPDTNTILLSGLIRGDSVRVELARMARHFQLAERQFHWLSEYNR